MGQGLLLPSPRYPTSPHGNSTLRSPTTGNRSDHPLPARAAAAIILPMRDYDPVQGVLCHFQEALNHRPLLLPSTRHALVPRAFSPDRLFLETHPGTIPQSQNLSARLTQHHRGISHNIHRGYMNHRAQRMTPRP